MVRLEGNYRGKSVETINQNLGPNYYIWSDKNFTIDFSASYDISKKVKLFIELNNLSNESLRLYMGDNKKRVTSNAQIKDSLHRVVKMERAYNFRDREGYKTTDGKEVVLGESFQK